MSETSNQKPEALGGHPVRPRSVTAIVAVAGLLLLTQTGRVTAQTQSAGGAPSTSATLQPALAELHTAVLGLRTAKWKAPGAVKQEADANNGSITRDLDATLPALVAQADAAPDSIANAFAVYRNLDALYEVLLRVSGTADLAASEAEATSLQHALGTLDQARHTLADRILSAGHAQEATLARQRQAQASAAAPPPSPAAAKVVMDGPVAQPARKKVKLKSKPSAPAPQP